MPQRIRRAQQDQSGFTLVELLIVIVILGILAAIVVFAVNGIQNKSAEAACKADVQTITTAAESFDAQYGYFAKDMSQLVKMGFLHSVPATDHYTVNYKVTGEGKGQRVDVSSDGCPSA
jgi:general secretion pathway protein G